MKHHYLHLVLGFLALFASLVSATPSNASLGVLPGASETSPTARVEAPPSDLTAAGAGWRIEVVEKGYVGEYNSLALDSTGRPHVPP